MFIGAEETFLLKSSVTGLRFTTFTCSTY